MARSSAAKSTMPSFRSMFLTTVPRPQKSSPVKTERSPPRVRRGTFSHQTHTADAHQPNLFDWQRNPEEENEEESLPPPYAASPCSSNSPTTDHGRPPTYTTPEASAAADDPFAFLATFDTVFLIDDSGSMAGSSWQQTSRALSAIAPICTAYDANGIDIHFLNASDRAEYRGVRSAERVHRIFQRVQPQGGTPTGTRLHQILQPYLLALTADLQPSQSPTTEVSASQEAPGLRPLNIIVITDGAASDDVESTITSAARRLNVLDAPAWQVGIQFLQVGREPGAAEALAELDDGLVALGCPRDIVDTVPWRGQRNEPLSAEGVLKVVLGAVHRRLDRGRNSAEHMRV